MNIVQLLHGRSLGGMEKFTLDLANALSSNHRVMVLADQAFGSYCAGKVVFQSFDTEASRNNPYVLYDIYRRIKAFNADIVHVHKQRSIAMLKRLGPFLPIPFVATKHDTQRKKAFYGLRYAAVISDEVARTVQADIVRKIYNGIQPVKPKPLALPGEFNFVAVGGLRPVKGFDRLIQAVATLPKTVHLTIVGEGGERAKLERLARHLGIAKRVHMVGFQKNVPDYLAACDAAVIASHSEGFSLAMVEALFYAPVLISTPVGVAPEILSQPLLYDLNKIEQAICHVYEHTNDYRLQTKRLAATICKQLTIDICAEEYSRFYDTIIQDFHAQGNG